MCYDMLGICKVFETKVSSASREYFQSYSDHENFFLICYEGEPCLGP